MNTKVLTTLEYTKIIDLLTEKADSEPGKKLCRELVPSTDLSAIRTAQRETKDALARLFRIGSTSFGSNRDLGFSIRSLEIGSSLSMSEFRSGKTHRIPSLKTLIVCLSVKFAYF